MQAPAGAEPDPSLATFGIVLTGRLGLRNDLLSTFTVGNDVWDERYFVLTRKGLHYYLRQRDSNDANRRDIFGEHEGSIALGNIALVDVGGEDMQRKLTFVVVSKSGGRKYTLKADSAELYQRWVATLQVAINPAGAPGNGSPGSGTGRNNSGTYAGMRSGMRSSSSFPRVPTLLDFRSPPRTDNLLNVTLFSSSLGLEVLLECGLPWGVQTTVSRTRHHVTCALIPSGQSSSLDALRLVLEGGATASIPLARTLLRRSHGSAIVPLQSPTAHKAIRLSWEAAGTAAPVAVSPAHRPGWLGATFVARSKRHQTAAAVAAAALFLASLASDAHAATADAIDSSPAVPPSAASILHALMEARLGSLPLLRPLLLLVAAVAALYAIGLASLPSVSACVSRRTPLRLARRLPPAALNRLPTSLLRAIASSAQPDG